MADPKGARVAVGRLAPRYNSGLTRLRILWCIALAMLTAVLLAPAAPEPDPRLWRHRVLGKALFENPATMPQAAAELKQAVALAPNSFADRLNYGIALLRAGETKQAIQELEKVEAIAPDVPHVHFNLALAYKRLGREPEAIREFEILARLAPSEPVTYFQLGMLYNLADRPAQALENFQRSARLDARLVAPKFQIYDFYRLAEDDAAAQRALADFQAAKSAMEAAGESEDMDWCFYAELYDPAVPHPSGAGREVAAAATYSKTLLGRVDPGSAGLAVIDAFGENRTDLLAWSRNGVLLFAGGSRPVPDSGLEKLRDVRAIAPGDFDNDGLTDLCVVTGTGAALYRNLRGRFERVPLSLPARSFESAVWLDFDHDYDLDLVLLGERPALVRNEGNLRFTDRTSLFPFVAGHAIGAAALRVDPDTKAVDLAVAYADRVGVLYRDRLRGQFEATPLDVLPPATRRLRAADLDGDGRADLELPGARLLNRGGRWERVDAPPAASGASVSAEGDFDADGRPDLATVAPDGTLSLLANRSAPRGHWIEIALAGIKNLKVPLWAEVEVKAAGHYEKRQYHGVPLLFDIGSAAAADVIRVAWPNGLIQNQIDTPAGRTVVREAPRLSGSCPTVFTWNGRAFQFIGDVLGVAPLGVSSADGQTFPVDTDEYLQIPAGALAPRAGKLDLRITEELHEVSYIDQVRLLAIDHPAGTTIVTNDKFKAPPFPEYRLFDVTRSIAPVAARDDAGRNQLPAILRVDGTYARGFRRDSRGVGAMHWLELVFPPESAPDNRAVLVLNGWIDWPDGSTFVAASQAGRALTLPYLEAKGDDGEWHTIIADMGVPSGGPKTIAVDLTGKFPGRSRTLRIVTNACVYWDRIVLSEDTAAPRVRTTTLGPATADLGLRGFSALHADGARERPETYDYDAWRPFAMWNPVPGKYTRYGDTRELLDSIDDRFVIMGSGDELRLAFDERALPELPVGWARDFLLYVDGWSKDGDANTAASTSVEPLPFHGMSKYPYAASEQFPADAAHKAWREQYNTRPAVRPIPVLAPGSSRGPRISRLGGALADQPEH